MLWERPIVALRDWLKAHPSQTFVFLNDVSGGYAAQALRNANRRFRDRNGLPKSLKLEHIRDGADSAAVNSPDVNEKAAKILAGQKFSGAMDAYAKRDIASVGAACVAIERHDFGDYNSD
ncbi:MAG: hypothetical protein C4547_13270 [Phycisphaerales bacterium]|nr:MAG: hypothetical protein C4547_13270 [Phycisphaerales bacterium]